MKRIKTLVSCVGLTSLLMAAMTSTSRADLINVVGTYSGAVGGEAFAANLTGSLADDGQGSGSATFNSVPSQLDSPAVLGVIFTFYCPIRPTKVGAVSFDTIFELSGGNYTLDRTWTFDGHPGTELVVAANATTLGTDLSIVGSLNGSVPVSGGDSIISYQQILRDNGAGSILESGTAILGSGLIARWTGEYQYAGSALGTTVITNLSWQTLEINGNTFNASWNAGASAVPEPSSLALIGVGIAGLASRVLSSAKRRAG